MLYVPFHSLSFSASLISYFYSDLVARRLQLGGFKVVRLQGTMTPTARDNTIKYFTNNPDVTVFLISLKAGTCFLFVLAPSDRSKLSHIFLGGVALNLTEASRVFILVSFLSELCLVLVLTAGVLGPLVERTSQAEHILLMT